MSNRIACTEINEMLFEYYRGELSDLKHLAFEEHFHTCASCSNLLIRIDTMFTLARKTEDETLWADLKHDDLFEQVIQSLEQHDDDEDKHDSTIAKARVDNMFNLAQQSNAESWMPSVSDRDALFARIANDIEACQPANDMESASDKDATTVVSLQRYRRARWAGIAIATAASLSLMSWWSVGSLSVFQSAGKESSLGAGFSTAGEFEAHITSTHVNSSIDSVHNDTIAGEQPPTFPEFPPLRPVSSSHASVRLFASANASVKVLDKSTTATRVSLDEGMLVVEYVPKTPTRIAVEAGGYTITVVGTVFFVRAVAEAVQVGVYEGAVHVITPQGDEHTLHPGDHFINDQQTQLNDSHHQQIVNYVDLEAHRLALRTQKPAPLSTLPASPKEQTPAPPSLKQPQQPTPGQPSGGTPLPESSPPIQLSEPLRASKPVTTEPVPESLPSESMPAPPEITTRQLREGALKARHNGDHKQAAKLLERALARTASDHPTSADILLELASIHLKELNNPTKASFYLTRFLQHWPDDPVAESIRKQLCHDQVFAQSQRTLCH